MGSRVCRPLRGWRCCQRICSRNHRGFRWGSLLRPSHDNCHNMHSTSRTLAVSRFNVDVASGSDDYWKDLGGCREIGWRRESSKCCWYELSHTYKKHPLVFHLCMHLVPPPTASIFATNSVSPTTAIPHISNATFALPLGPTLAMHPKLNPRAPPEMRNSPLHLGRLCHHTPSLHSLFSRYM